MDVDIPKPICERYCDLLSADPFDMEIKTHTFRDTFNLDLAEIPAATLEELANTLEADPKPLRGQKTLIRDIRMWNKARTPTGVKSAKARNVKQAVTDLVQNAVVGVFLRVLEYFSGVLFLATNRLDAIDDAILSRCTARIQYGVPTKDEQKQIWTILADQNGLDIPKDQLARIVHKFPMAGREIKNVLKLCMMVAGNDAAKITVELVDTIKDFRPTGIGSAAEDGVVINKSAAVAEEFDDSDDE